MKKTLAIATLLSTALLASSPAQAASYQDRAMTTGAVVGATTGAVVGSNSNQTVEGAIFGAVLGTIAGAIIANNNHQATVVHTRHRPVVKRHVYTQHRPVVKRHARVAKQRAHLRHERYVAQGYGHQCNQNRWGDYRAAKRHDSRAPVQRHDRSERRNHRGHIES